VNQEAAGIEAGKEAISEVATALFNLGLSPPARAKKLKSKLQAKVTKTAKLKGRVDKTTLRRGVRVVAESSVPQIDKEGVAYEDGDTIISWNENAHDIQLRALDMVFTLCDDYPAKRHEVGGKNGRPIDINHRFDPGGALQTVIERLTGATRQPPTNGDTK